MTASNNNSFIKIFIFIILFFSQFNHVLAKQREIFNTPTSVASPSSTYPILYTINATRASLVQLKPQQFKLTLSHVYETINYINAHSPQSSELINTEDFVTAWNDKKNSVVEADITGIQVNNKKFGHAQFYTTALLTDVHFYKDTNKLTFILTSAHPPINMTNDYATFENVTLFINGCDLCNCKKENSSSIIQNCIKSR